MKLIKYALVIICITFFSSCRNSKIEECIDSAYNEIKDRKGGMKNGTFVKD